MVGSQTENCAAASVAQPVGACKLCGGSCAAAKPAAETAAQPIQVLAWAMLEARTHAGEAPYWQAVRIAGTWDRAANRSDPLWPVVASFVDALPELTSSIASDI